ncbi:MAG: hypothetical protein ACD_50C00076G0005 [uncultured bacterium]|nr:MAG: hypothetical protein ACD_50C00076G0005 [uncultured bacterium]OGH14517.1 MAG: hypothetical protein A2687_05645 [Candidatus Levybacteria bacterium RIFCSPHIGHO2_01_FULL_38_26]
MSIREVESSILDLRLEDDMLETPGMCRYAAERMLYVANESNLEEPRANIEILVWRKASSTEKDIHYALKASSPDGKIIFNPNPSPLFPQYVGPVEKAPGYIPQMTVTKEIL